MEVLGYYGVSSLHPCTIFTYGNAYCISGSRNVCFTRQAVLDGTNVETLDDYDSFTAAEEIVSIDQLREAVDE